jgi:hypothetical protein
MPEELQKGISAGFKLSFEHGDHGWKYMDKNNVIETLYEGFDHLRRTQF